MTAKRTPPQELIDRLAAEADAQGETSGPRPGAKTTRGHGRAKVLQIRLNPDELERLERAADERGLPVSTLARDYLLRGLDTPVITPGSLDRPTLRASHVAQFVAAIAAVPPGTFEAIAEMREEIVDNYDRIVDLDPGSLVPVRDLLAPLTPNAADPANARR